jgi:hypothetical protein
LIYNILVKLSGVIQHNVGIAKIKRTKGQTMIHNTLPRHNRSHNTNPTKNGGDLRCPGRIDSSCIHSVTFGLLQAQRFEFLIYNILVKLSGVIQHNVGIPMGTNCAPLLADILISIFVPVELNSIIAD